MDLAQAMTPVEGAGALDYLRLKLPGDHFLNFFL